MVDPNKRYSLENIKSHQWFQSLKAEDEYYKPMIVSPHTDTSKKAETTQIDTPRISQKNSRHKIYSEDWIDSGSSQGTIHTELEDVHSFDYVTKSHTEPFNYDQDEEKKEVKKSKSQKLNPLVNSKNPLLEKRRSLQIRLEKFDPNNNNGTKDNPQTYEQIMQQYPRNNGNNAILLGDNSSDISDYSPSDFESSPSMSPRNIEPISMTAFDLIGIVSTQMLNNVFTDHYKIHHHKLKHIHVLYQIQLHLKYYTQFKKLYIVLLIVHVVLLQIDMK